MVTFSAIARNISTISVPSPVVSPDSNNLIPRGLGYNSGAQQVFPLNFQVMARVITFTATN